VAFALTEFRSVAFYDTVRAVRAIAYQRILDLPKDVPVILTNAHMQDSAWGNECWDAVIELARTRGSGLIVVILECSPEENARRIQSSERDSHRKPRDPRVARGECKGPSADRPWRRATAAPGHDIAFSQTSAERILAWLTLQNTASPVSISEH
jgi:hypothetical protein